LYLMLAPLAIMGIIGYRWWKSNKDVTSYTTWLVSPPAKQAGVPPTNSTLGWCPHQPNKPVPHRPNKPQGTQFYNRSSYCCFLH
jgi:hypothetical protein